MRITYGWTRLVILTKRYAIKFSFWSVVGFFPLAQSLLTKRRWLGQQLAEHRQGKEGAHRTIARRIQEVLCLGISANRQEVKLSREHPELPLARVVASYLGDHIIVMERGEPVPARTSRYLRYQYKGSDMSYPNHVCSFDGELRFVDYGNPKAPEALGLK